MAYCMLPLMTINQSDCQHLRIKLLTANIKISKVWKWIPALLTRTLCVDWYIIVTDWCIVTRGLPCHHQTLKHNHQVLTFLMFRGPLIRGDPALNLGRLWDLNMIIFECSNEKYPAPRSRGGVAWTQFDLPRLNVRHLNVQNVQSQVLGVQTWAPLMSTTRVALKKTAFRATDFFYIQYSTCVLNDLPCHHRTCKK